MPPTWETAEQFCAAGALQSISPPTTGHPGRTNVLGSRKLGVRVLHFIPTRSFCCSVRVQPVCSRRSPCTGYPKCTDCPPGWKCTYRVD